MHVFVKTNTHIWKGEWFAASFLLLQVLSDQEEDIGELNKENMWELSCETVREQLTNSIRKQWRMLKNHVEKLDNQGWCLTALCVHTKYILEKVMQM